MKIQHLKMRISNNSNGVLARIMDTTILSKMMNNPIMTMKIRTIMVTERLRWSKGKIELDAAKYWCPTSVCWIVQREWCFGGINTFDVNLSSSSCCHLTNFLLLRNLPLIPCYF